MSSFWVFGRDDKQGGWVSGPVYSDLEEAKQATEALALLGWEPEGTPGEFPRYGGV